MENYLAEKKQNANVNESQNLHAEWKERGEEEYIFDSTDTNS